MQSRELNGFRHCGIISVSIEFDVVAVVDDDPLIRHGLNVLLLKAGYQVDLYDSGESFLQSAATCNAICLLVDIQLGGASGFDLASQLARKGLEFPIIFMMDKVDKKAVRRAAEVGGIGCFQKPLAEVLLMRLLTRTKRTQ